MQILALNIERDHDNKQLCGSLTYQSETHQGLLLWTVDAQPHRIDVRFVQGDSPDWDQWVEQHLATLSDKLILEIARHRGLPALETSHPAFAFAG